MGVDANLDSLPVVPSVTAFCCVVDVVGVLEATDVPAETVVLPCDVAACCSGAELETVLGISVPVCELLLLLLSADVTVSGECAVGAAVND